jgi:DNA polymerase-3 subunit epsilon
MKLNLNKDLVLFDIESTGLSTSQDRIVQLAIIKIFADGREPLKRCRLINPEMPIPQEASEVHGIKDEDVANAPTFKQLSKALEEMIGDADLCGYNSNRFDVPMLLEEFDRAGVDFDMTDRKTIDVWKIFQKMEPRDLKSAYKMYCGKELVGGHDALVDVEATLEVLEAQLDYYADSDFDDGKGNIEEKPVRNDMQALEEFTNFKGRMDYSSRFVMNDDGVPLFNFGKYQSQSVTDVIESNPGYYDWFMKAEFTVDAKRTLERIMTEYRAKIHEEKQKATSSQ